MSFFITVRNSLRDATPAFLLETKLREVIVKPADKKFEKLSQVKR